MYKKLLVVSVVAALAACGPSQQAPQPDPNAAPGTVQAPPSAPAPAPPPREVVREAPPAPVCESCGTIVAVNEEKVDGQAGLLGTLGGAAAGGLAGGQFGKKSGKILMTVGGAVAGAFAGREVQEKATAKTVYHVGLRMNDGSERTVTVADLNGLSVGNKVRVNGDHLEYMD